MTVKKEYTPDQLEHRRALSRERNRRYLAKRDPEVMAKRKAASAAYVERLKTDPLMAEKAALRKKKAVARTALWMALNPEKTRANAKACRQRNPDKEAAKVQRRNAAKLNATPFWANQDAINKHYMNARYLTEVTGQIHHVDHIVPLRGKFVCGLHVEYNLRAIPHFLNTRKGNKHSVEV